MASVMLTSKAELHTLGNICAKFKLNPASSCREFAGQIMWVHNSSKQRTRKNIPRQMKLIRQPDTLVHHILRLTKMLTKQTWKHENCKPIPVADHPKFTKNQIQEI